MLDEFKKYRHIRRSISSLQMEELLLNVGKKLWKDSEYNTIYCLGAIMLLHRIALTMRETDHIGKNDVLDLINSYKEHEDAPDDIRKIVDQILIEFDYKEATK